jgi:hypothetical protein
MAMIYWLLRNFVLKKINSEQTLFWILLLLGAEVLTLFPVLVDKITLFWGNLVPVSWITFAGISSLIVYLLYQTIHQNKLNAHIIQLTRNITFLEKRVRELEAEASHRYLSKVE